MPSVIQVKDLQQLIYEFAGPWDLEQSLQCAVDNMVNEVSWDLPLTNWTTCLSGFWDLLITLEYWGSRPHFPMYGLNIKVEDADTCEITMVEYHMSFHEFDEMISFLQQDLNDFLPKMVHIQEKIMIQSPLTPCLFFEDPRTNWGGNHEFEEDDNGEESGGGCDVLFEKFAQYFL